MSNGRNLKHNLSRTGLLYYMVRSALPSLAYGNYPIWLVNQREFALGASKEAP